MSRHKRYMLKQKLIGLFMVIASLLGALIDPELGGAMVMTAGLLGTGLIFTRKMVWMDDYYNEMKETRNYKWRVY